MLGARIRLRSKLPTSLNELRRDKTPDRSDIFAQLRQSCSSDPFSFQSEQLQPDYVSSYNSISFVCIYIQKIRAEIGDVERMLKALIKSLENKHLDP